MSKWADEGKRVYISGLDGDFKREVKSNTTLFLWFLEIWQAARFNPQGGYGYKAACSLHVLRRRRSFHLQIIHERTTSRIGCRRNLHPSLPPMLYSKKQIKTTRKDQDSFREAHSSGRSHGRRKCESAEGVEGTAILRSSKRRKC